MRRLPFVGVIAAVAACLASTPAEASLQPTRSGMHLGRPSQHYFVKRDSYRISAREYSGRGPALVLLHGFPDNSHLYDALVPHLRGRRVVTFDFLGWGRSDKPQQRRYTFAGQVRDLHAVIDQLKLGRIELVAHDAGVPAAVNWALAHPGQTVSLTLMNGFYEPTPAVRPPALIALLALGQLPPGFGIGGLPRFATSLGALGREVTRDAVLFGRIFAWQERQFMSRPADARRYTPLFARQFRGASSSLVPLRSLTADLVPAVAANAPRMSALATASFPLRLIWGDRDPDLSIGVAKALREKVSRAELHVLSGARHNLQIDRPKRLAALLLRKNPRAGSPHQSRLGSQARDRPPIWTPTTIAPTGR
jgi:haloalkane dehalogenase